MTDDEVCPTIEEAVGLALNTAEEGETIILCRAPDRRCPGGMRDCRHCAQILWQPGLTVADVLAQARPHA